MKSEAVLIALERGIEDGAQRNPPAQRGDAGAERMRARGHMREVAAGRGTRRVNRTEVPVQEDAAVFLAFENASRRSLRIRVRRVPNYLFTIHVEVSGQGLDLGLADGNHRMTAAIRAGGAIDLALESNGEGLKLLDSTVVGRQITPELEVFGLLDISKPADLHQIGYHALRILPRPTEGKRLQSETPWNPPGRRFHKCYRIGSLANILPSVIPWLTRGFVVGRSSSSWLNNKIRAAPEPLPP